MCRFRRHRRRSRPGLLSARLTGGSGPGRDVRWARAQPGMLGLSAASGKRLLARGQVIRPGRTLTVCRGDAYAKTGEDERHVATILTTMIALGEA